ncbi:hypothetical protein HYX10_03430 [Candidatus Woesearchaeota archaeon]|nr:hypothetical protein [Candidatus Woesearchaeota archaeon]
MEMGLVGFGVISLLLGIGGTLRVGFGGLVVGGTLGGVLIVLGYIL